jgi:hypothetical protein
VRILAILALTACWRDAGPPPASPAETTRTATAATTTWTTAKGTCHGRSWGEVEFDIALSVRGQIVEARGTLDFADRHTKAKLRGDRGDLQHLHLTGSMTEPHPDSLRTTWKLELDVEVGPNDVVTSLRFTEVIYDGGKEFLCAWKP